MPIQTDENSDIAAVAIDLEVLNVRDQPITHIAASLRQMAGHSAVIALAAGTPAPCLHWGARVRFDFTTPTQHYLVTGSVVGLHSAAAPEQNSAPLLPPREVVLKLWECRAVPQRRAAVRRRAGFARALP